MTASFSPLCIFNTGPHCWPTQSVLAASNCGRLMQFNAWTPRTRRWSLFRKTGSVAFKGEGTFSQGGGVVAKSVEWPSHLRLWTTHIKLGTSALFGVYVAEDSTIALSFYFPSKPTCFSSSFFFLSSSTCNVDLD